MKEKARELAGTNQRVFKQGHYKTAKGHVVAVGEMVKSAVEGTRLYRPDELKKMLEGAPRGRLESLGIKVPEIRVENAKSGELGRRLAHETDSVPAVLNFASAKNPGGGYLKGSRAQEEDLCRCSSLYEAIKDWPDFHLANRKQKSMLYTDHILWSPSVPFIRDEDYKYLDTPVPLSVITAPAPNVGALAAEDQPKLEATILRRAGMVLAVAADNGARNLVLGAWGCGVFRNDPTMVAESFLHWLKSPRFANQFDLVTFAVYVGRGRDQSTLDTFREVLS